MEIQPIDITQIIVAIISAGGAIYAIWRQQHPPSSIEKEPKTSGSTTPKNKALIIVMCICIALLAGNLGIFGWRYSSHTDIKITYPFDGATVEIREMVRGSSNRIPKGATPWVVVYSQAIGHYYPQNDPPDVQADGDWSSLSFIGVEEDVGKKFDIIVVLLNKSARDMFDSYLLQAKDKETWPGLGGLPEGAVIYDRITVTRG